MRKRIEIFSCVSLLAITVTLWAATPKFYDDDPIQREPETRDASAVKSWKIDLVWDLAYNLFAHPGDPALNVRAQNINTIDEVPDSSWFVNRILARSVSIEEAIRGPNTDNGPAPPPWTLIAGKDAGAAPGFTMKDSRGAVWFVSFDAKDYPEAATSAIIVANKIFWTLGYWQVENNLLSIRPENIVIAETAQIRLTNGKKVPMRRKDLDDVFRRSERSVDGSYRAAAGKGLSGTILNGFKYDGTRPDDPNDIVPHEHRRELRALRVFGAWTNLVDMKAGNTVDTLIDEGGKRIVRHYLQDVGSTFGAAAEGPHDYFEGFEYIYDGAPMLKRLATFGFYIRPWQTANYREHPSLGRFESDAFVPEQWKPRVPTSAFVHARPDDNFWAARRVMAFSNEMIRAIVKTGQFHDAAVEKQLADTLIARRDKIGKAYFNAVNPLVNFALDANGSLTFVNAAVAAGFATPPPAGYTSEWAIFDNRTNETQPRGNATSTAARLQAPAGLPTLDGSFVKLRVSAVQAPIDVYFRRTSGTWKLVGLER